jgi:hypothetical protein
MKGLRWTPDRRAIAAAAAIVTVAACAARGVSREEPLAAEFLLGRSALTAPVDMQAFTPE